MASRTRPKRDQTPAKRGGPASSTQRRTAAGHFPAALAGGALVAMVLAAYVAALGAGFIWDDEFNVTTNATLRSLDGLRQMWFVPRSIQQYYPLMYTTYWVEYHLWELKPFGYHFDNVLLHATAVLLLWRLLLRLQVPGAWLAAAIFAVHPVEVESVVWITERKNVLSLTLALLSMLCYLRFAPPEGDRMGEPPSPARWRWYALSFLSFALAMFAKTVVLSLPAVLLVIYWWKRGRLRWVDVARLAPFFTLGVALGLTTVWMETHHVGAKGEEWSLIAGERVLLSGRAIWFYVGKLAWPHPLAFLYPRFAVDVPAWRQWLLFVAAISVPVALWLARGRIGRGPLAAVLIYVGVLAPALGFFNIYFTRFAQVADHFQYHASVAMIALAAAGAALVATRLPAGWRGIANATAAVVLVALAALTVRQTFIYQDLETLYRDTIAKNPKSWMAYGNLSEHLNSQGRYDEAIDLLEKCLAIYDAEDIHDRRYLLAESSLGFVLLEVQRFDDARPHFVAALSVDPDDCRSLYGLGMSLAATDRFAEAQACFEHALQVDPDHAEAHYGLAVALGRQGRAEEATSHFRKSLELNATDPLVHFEFGNLLAQQRDLRQAAVHYAEAVRLRPGYVDALHNLGVVLKDSGDVDRAIPRLQEALRLNPSDADTKAALEEALRMRQKQRGE
ncbi:MAG: tetratricopeptide repeat protein [Planctomycetia bacterium]|nr:tetratricopeptide repeat protein [Planctomycetia bacterium]